MKTLTYTEKIEAPANKVFRKMLGLDDVKDFEAWTKPFNPTSSYKGSWEKGEKIYFLGTDDKGNTGGMVSEIADRKTDAFISIRHYGILDGDKEILEGPDVEKWADGFENYTFSESDGITTVVVDLDTTDDFVDFFNKTYPEALKILKDNCEK